MKKEGLDTKCQRTPKNARVLKAVSSELKINSKTLPRFSPPSSPQPLSLLSSWCVGSGAERCLSHAGFSANLGGDTLPLTFHRIKT